MVALQGDIDINTVDEARQVLIEAATSGATAVVIDLSAVSLLDSTGVNALFLIARRLRERNQHAALVVPSGSFLRKVFGVTAIDELLPLFGDASDAVAAVQAQP